MRFSVAFTALLSSASATILWDGRFNTFSTSADLEIWSWSNQVGPYQYYIHGPSSVSSYVNFSPSYKNPADSGSNQGAKITLDSTAYWNGQTMRRTELIPQTTAAITTGTVWYHFSIMRSATNPPSIYREHQICFFESHFTELKSGWISGASGTSDPALRWDVGGVSKWSVNWDAGVWHNVAYEINFSANTVAFHHSTGSDPLVLTVPAVSVSTSSNGADWHLGVLELPVSGQADSNEDFYFSGVYIENGSLTTSVAGPGGVVVSSSAAATTSKTSSSTKAASSTSTSSKVSSSTSSIKVSTSSTSSKASTTVATTLTTSTKATSVSSSSAAASTGTLKKYDQCGGIGWGGSGTCVGSVCTYSNDWYSQCL